MGNSISRETFDDADEKTKLNMLFDLSWDSNVRLRSLEKRKKYDTVFSGFMGFAGGATAILARWLIGDERPL